MSSRKLRRALVPAGAPCLVISDSGGHQSGASAERNGYQRTLALVASGCVAGIAVYDLSRLARNASLMLPLRDELERRQIPIRAATMPNSQWDGASGRFMFGQLCLAAQYQRDLDSERMTGLTRTIFESGGHRGADPFGYRTIRDQHGGITKPRTQEIVEPEAKVVRRIWRELPSKSTNEIARDLQRDGVRRRGLSLVVGPQERADHEGVPAPTEGSPRGRLAMAADNRHSVHRQALARPRRLRGDAGRRRVAMMPSPRRDVPQGGRRLAPGVAVVAGGWRRSGVGAPFSEVRSPGVDCDFCQATIELCPRPHRAGRHDRSRRYARFRKRATASAMRPPAAPSTRPPES